MTPRQHLEYVREIAELDGRYLPEAFLFISEAVVQTSTWIKDGVLEENDVAATRGEGDEFHVSGQELLAGILKLTRERWGELAPQVFRSWGVYKTDDFGEIVFLMVEDEKLKWRCRECDRREDFCGGFDFDTAYEDW